MRKTILMLAVIVGIAAVLSGLAAGAGFTLLRIMAGSDLLTNTLGWALAAAGMGLGLLLAVNGWRALAGQPGARFYMPPWGWWLLAFALILIGGQLLLSGGSEFLAPLFHVLAAVIPPLLYLALAAGRVSRALIPARSMWGSLAWGGVGGVGLGFFIEALALVGLIVVASIWLSAARPDLLAQLQTWAEEMQRGGGMPDLEQLAWLRSPLVLLGVLLFASVFVPVVEEVAKSLAVPLVGLTGRKLSRLDGFLLGVAAGAGFALVEGMFNGALGLSQPEGWAGGMLTRGGASAMHCLASGLFGLGWQAVISERRYGRGVGLAALSVLLHGLWNAGALGVGLSGLTRPSVGFGALNLRDVQSVFIGGLLVTLWLLAVVTLAWLPRRLMEE